MLVTGYDSDEASDQARNAEEKAKKERNDMIRQEFEARKSKLTKREVAEKEKEEKACIEYAKVKAAAFTAKKIPGLEVKARESYLGLLESNLKSNYEQFKKVAKTDDDLKDLSPFHISQCAIDEEYKIFTNNKVFMVK